MKKLTYPDLTLAVSLSARGYAYVFFEATQTPFDWGVVAITGQKKNVEIGKRIQKLLRLYQPQMLILENFAASRRPDRIKKLTLSLGHLAHCEGVGVAVYSRRAIRAAFAPLGAQTKVEIARAIALAIPAFGHRMPPARKIWMSLDSRQVLFDAAALGITHLARSGEAEREISETRR